VVERESWCGISIVRPAKLSSRGLEAVLYWRAKDRKSQKVWKHRIGSWTVERGLAWSGRGLVLVW